MRKIGQKIKNLRLQKGLTQEELGERTDLSKGYISQLERDLSSPSIETLFDLLEVLGISPHEFFAEGVPQKIVYTQEEATVSVDMERGYHVSWLIPESNEKEMEPVLLMLEPNGAFKQYEPSAAETFVYVLEGTVTLMFGAHTFEAKTGEALYYLATEPHQLKNLTERPVRMLVIATDSYL